MTTSDLVHPAALAAPSRGHRLGPADAPVSLLVYGTYECLHCRRAWPALRELVHDAGARVRLEWRHFGPPGAFPNAPLAAAAAEAAARQDAFWPMHEALLAAPTPLWPEALLRLAGALGLDVGRLERDVAHPDVRARVAEQTALAAADGVRRTPAVRLVPADAPDGGGAWLDTRDPAALADQLRARLAVR